MTTTKLMSDLTIALVTRPEQIKLTQISKTKDLAKDVAEAVKALYKHHDINMRLFGTILNSMATQQRVVFLLSKRLVGDLLKKDKNVRRSTIDSRTYKELVTVLMRGGVLTRVHTGEGMEASAFMLNGDFCSLVLGQNADLSEIVEKQKHQASQLFRNVAEETSRNSSQETSHKTSPVFVYEYVYESGFEQKGADVLKQESFEDKIEDKNLDLNLGETIPRTTSSATAEEQNAEKTKSPELEPTAKATFVSNQHSPSDSVPSFELLCQINSEAGLPNYNDIVRFVGQCFDLGLKMEDMDGFTFIKILFRDSRTQAKKVGAVKWAEWKKTARSNFDSAVAKQFAGHLLAQDPLNLPEVPKRHPSSLSDVLILDDNKWSQLLTPDTEEGANV